MRKILFPITFLVIVGLSGFLLYGIINRMTVIEETVRTKHTIAWFFDYISEETDISLKAGFPVVLIFFNTKCDFCQEEARIFQQRKVSLSGAQWFWISEENSKSIDQFAYTYRLLQIEGLFIIKDSNGVLTERVGVSSIPQILIYDRSGILVKEFRGETRIDAILEVLK